METATIATAEGPHFTSAYLEQIKYATWDGERTVKDFTELYEMRAALEGELGLTTEGFIPELYEGNGNKYHDSAVDAMGKILAREHNGVTLRELEDTDRDAANRARQKAMQEGLMDFADASAQAILTAEAPTVRTASIEGYIENLSKKKTPEEMADLQEKQEEAEYQFRTAQEKYEKLRRQH